MTLGGGYSYFRAKKNYPKEAKVERDRSHHHLLRSFE
jgi:hypothetical protein